VSNFEKIEKDEINILSPFKLLVLENFPFIEADFDAITNYQLMCKMTEYMNSINTNVNTLNENENRVYNAFNELVEYINNYFDNLDVQEEINNKLDSMVESGEMQTILNSLLEPIENKVDGIRSDVNILTERVNNITELPEGSTSGDAELTDIRIGGNGVTYSSAGNSVRGQYDALHNTNKHFDKYELNLTFTPGFIKPVDLSYGNGGDHTYSNVFLLPAMSILHMPRITRSNSVVSICECDIEGNPTKLIWKGCGIQESDGSYCYFITTEDIYIRVAGNINDAVKNYNHYYVSKFDKDIIIDDSNFATYGYNSVGDVYGNGGLTSNSSSIPGYIHSTNFFIPKGFTIEFYSAGNTSNWALSEWDYNYGRVRSLILGNNEIQHLQYTSDKNQFVRLSGMTTPIANNFNDIIPVNKWKGWKMYYKPLHYDKNNILYGKKLTVMGDSLIYGNRLGNGATWVTNVGINNNMVYTNLGDNGNPVAVVENSGEVAMVDRIDTIPTDTEYFVLLGGANDKRLNVPIGEINSTDKTSFYGALNTIIAGVRDRCPKAKILLLTTYNRFASKNTYNLGDIDYAEAMIQAGRNNLVPVFDNFHNSGVNFLDSKQDAWMDESRNVQKFENNQTVYIDDTHHFSIEGYEWITPIYENLLKGL